MQTVRVPRQGITRDQAIAALGKALGPGYKLDPDGDGLEVQKGVFARAAVKIENEPDGTVFRVTSQTMPIPLLIVALKVINDRGIVRRVAETIGQPDTFRTEV
jgi:hypothetical protein